MKSLLFVPLIVLLFGCSSSPVKRKLETANDVVLFYYTGEGRDSIYKIVHTSDKKAIETLVGYIDGKHAESHCTAYNGQIVFAKDGKAIDSIQFNTQSAQCRVFMYMIDGNYQTVTMSNEAADMLIALREERKFY